MLDGVVGVLGLSVILDVVDSVLRAAGHGFVDRGEALVVSELVALVLVGRCDLFLDRDHRRIVVDPCSGGLLYRIISLLDAINEVLDGVVGVLGLSVILDIFQRDGRTACDLGGVLIHGDGIELVAGVGLLIQRALLDGDHRVLLVDPCSRGVVLGVLHLTSDHMLDGVFGFLGLGVILDVVNINDIVAVFLKS